MSAVSPILAAWELGVHLREAREAADFTGTEAAKRVGMSQNHLSNIECGRRSVTVDRLDDLIDLYGFGAVERDELVHLREAASQRGWWQRYRGILSAEFVRFIGCEDGAEHVRTYESALISGLLQTPEYARAVHRGDRANLRKSEVDRRVEVRQNRSARLTGEDPLRAEVVMAEAALYQQVGGSAVLSEQLRHLLELIEKQENLDLRILPFAASACAAMGGATFHVLSFSSSRLPHVSWEETAVTMGLVAEPAQVHQYSEVFAEVQECALSPDESFELIRNRLASLE